MKRIRSTSAGRSMTPKVKMVKKEIFHDDGYNKINEGVVVYQSPALKPSVEISSCISYQKFRYSGENRPGKKYQEKEFMTLKLNNLADKVVRVVIICTDADNRELIHPNGLVGKDCHDGIYDKEYAVTKSSFVIKIPYLRTERIKTKKNEHSKIQRVLSERASHLPSPYKERCLSQCTDKYTASRKFDTTKVCLGVIVTVQSHQGPFNGSLHAISHVVRNASEKTSLNILKLSQNVVASYGGVIDIFTTEDGPAIEPEKYVVYVSVDLGNDSRWESDRHQPTKEEILYKRIITYNVPQFEPSPNLDNNIEGSVHLECPQSNQYCSFQFHYGPHGGIVIEQDQNYNGHKYYAEQQDIKPTKLRLRQEIYEPDASSETIKANLKSKLTSRQGEQIYIEASSESRDENHFIIQEPIQNFNPQQTVLIRHQDPQTGESSYLLDMDASKNLTNGINGSQQYVQQYALERINENDSVQGLKTVRGKRTFTTSPDVQVVATGFSDAVPPNTTVLIYTTNGGFEEHVAIEGASGEQVVIQEVSDEEAAASSSIIVTDEEPEARSAQSNSSQSEQVVRREMVAEKNMTSSKQSAQSANGTASDKSDRGATQSVSDHVIQGSERHAVAVRGSFSSGNVHGSASSEKPITDRLSPAPTSSPSTIPPLRRMLISIPSKSSTSAWEVGTDEDQSECYNLINYGYEKKQSSVKIELTEHDIQKIQAPSSNYQNQYVTQKQVHIAESSVSNDGSSFKSASKEVEGSNKQDSSDCQKLTSMDFNMQQAIVENLPTMKVIELAEIIESGLPSTTAIEQADS
ncbi:hypothetical protein Btru_046805 [Bulinus truncatus]|nr:hypothetical protein Btru_046805 [Bulinus truncatus]